MLVTILCGLSFIIIYTIEIKLNLNMYLYNTRKGRQIELLC